MARHVPMAIGLSALLAACMPSEQDARRAPYLACARAQGVEVRDGTIVTRDADDIMRLNRCEANPR